MLNVIPTASAIMTGLVGIMLKFPSLFYFKLLLKSLHYAQFYSFCASSITIPYLQLKLPITVNYLSHLILMLVEPLKSTYFTFINAFIVLNPEWEIALLSFSHFISFTFSIICDIFSLFAHMHFNQVHCSRHYTWFLETAYEI